MTQLNQNNLSPLRVEKLNHVVGDFTLQAEFSIGVGERASLVGKSGSGKTTLLRILAGLEPLSRGRIFLGERDVTQVPPQKREVGFVFQDQALFSGMNVLENVTFGLRMKGIPRQERERLALEWLEKVGLGTKQKDPVDQLSGGERQRVAFVRALIWKPKLVLLDEPFSALDLTLREVLRKELIALHQLWPAPLLLVTHDESDIQSLATQRLSLEANPQSSVRTVSPQLTNG